jgi:hypothetical protein
MLPPAPSNAGSIAATAPAPSPRAAADEAQRAQAAAIEATNAAPRTGATWPPRAVVRASSEASLQSLVEPVSLPPELEPARRWRFVYWLMGLAAVGGVVLAFQNPSSVRQVYDVLFGPKREPGASTEATTTPTATDAPTAREPAAHPHGTATGTATGKPGTRPRK